MLLESGKQYVIRINDPREAYSVLHVDEVVFSYQLNGEWVYELQTKEFVKDIAVTDDDIIEIVEVTNGNFYPQDLSYEELVQEMVFYITRHEDKIGEEEEHVNLFTVMRSKLTRDYGVDDYEYMRQISYDAYNRTHDRQLEYKPK